MDSLYFGGGTPTVLEMGHWQFLFKSLCRHFSFAPGAEISVEANPESAAPDQLSLLKDLGVNRISLGLQAVQTELLRALGRRHDFPGFERAFREARKAGFGNINVDLMYGLPGQTKVQWEETLRRVLALGPEHISAYALTIEEDTPFAAGGVKTDDDLAADQYEEAHGRLTAAGYAHYEISNFAKPGFECRHNLKYWLNENCLGAGVSAAWHWDGIRRKNTENLDDYLSALEAGRSPVVEETRLTEAEREGENLMLGLRLAEGVEAGPRARELYGDVLGRFRELGFLTEETPNRFRPTLLGWKLSNRLFMELLEPSLAL